MGRMFKFKLGFDSASPHFRKSPRNGDDRLAERATSEFLAALDGHPAAGRYEFTV